MSCSSDFSTADARLNELTQWAEAELGQKFKTQAIVNDASFRRYFRCTLHTAANAKWQAKLGANKLSLILMDAPPQLESCASFVNLQQVFARAKVPVPAIYSVDLSRGAMLLEDLGDNLFFHALEEHNQLQLYQSALQALLNLQSNTASCGLNPYSQQILEREMNLYRHWYLERHLNYSLSASDLEIWQNCRQLLSANALTQAQTVVHRDYHSRNILLDAAQNIKIIDFQDALYGPVTYDAVSLLRDCYIVLPQTIFKQLLSEYYQQLLAKKLIDVDFARFKTQFDLMGVQRHLKAIGIFARLAHRDQKNNYLPHIPRTMDYIQQQCAVYPQLQQLQKLLKTRPTNDDADKHK